MIRGRFGDTTTTPFVEASVHLPRLDLRGYVSFLLDTGASGTVLMPTDSKKLSIGFDLLKNAKISRTVGGPAKGYMENAVLAFLDRDTKKIYAYDIDIQIFEPTRDNATLPSLLGRDVLNCWRLVIDYPKLKCDCTPRKWDFRLNSNH
jgi:predicted aspartyl protease